MSPLSTRKPDETRQGPTSVKRRRTQPLQDKRRASYIHDEKTCATSPTCTTKLMERKDLVRTEGRKGGGRKRRRPLDREFLSWAPGKEGGRRSEIIEDVTKNGKEGAKKSVRGEGRVAAGKSAPRPVKGKNSEVGREQTEKRKGAATEQNNQSRKLFGE